MTEQTLPRKTRAFRRYRARSIGVLDEQLVLRKHYRSYRLSASTHESHSYGNMATSQNPSH